MTRSWSDLEQHFSGISHLEHAMALMEWDQATLLSDRGQGARAEAMAELQLVINQRLRAPGLADSLSQLSQQSMSASQQRLLELMSRRVRDATLLDDDFVRRRVTLSVACETRWRQARNEDDFSLFKAAFEPVLALLKEEAEIRRSSAQAPLYQGLLNKFEPDLSLTQLQQLFVPLKARLPALIAEASERSRSRSSVPLPQVEVDQQRQALEALLPHLGFDLDGGRLDTSTHPFSAGVPSDVRITTRYDHRQPLSAVYSMIHEAGHGCFEQGIAARWHHTPMARVQSAALHEAQALSFEMQLAREPDFIQWLSEFLQRHWGAHPGLEADNLGAHIGRVQPSLIRVEADEVTYPAHILLRLELEQALLSGDLPLSDLPGAWRHGMQTLLGVSPDNNRDGCLQDIHWCFGEFGYFPSYALGAMAAAQVFAGLRQSPQWRREPAARGQWVRQQLQAGIWQHGGGADLNQSCLNMTGQPLSAEALLNHLSARYLA
ncbi:hypothetical protein [Ferrimonas kyonanensis]|uniref:hypothetical protein n=1 Tax=Ferrimonas kyonanensis TaxID=364763 RepID=UPI000488094A|nr:hypothetical protein [Ferrimonas kyonanensis]